VQIVTMLSQFEVLGSAEGSGRRGVFVPTRGERSMRRVTGDGFNGRELDVFV